VHAHPPAAVACGLAGLELRPVFGSYNIPAMRMALTGVPVYPRSVLIRRDELAEEMLAVLADRRVCLLRGHGIVAAGETLEEATVAAVNLNELCLMTLELGRLGASPPVVPPEDLAELPDLGSRFNDELAWRSLVADLGR
ncbi:MAG: class II aldolase/adducin family protein, partial [Acidimicrobiales bacterium]